MHCAILIMRCALVSVAIGLCLSLLGCVYTASIIKCASIIMSDGCMDIVK